MGEAAHQLPAVVAVCADFVQVVAHLLYGFVYKNRLAGVHSGYTYHHLPVFPKNTDAIPASFAARIAFSNF